MSRYKTASLFRITKKWRCPDCGGLVRTEECIACWVATEKGVKRRVYQSEQSARDVWDRTHRGSTPRRWLPRSEPNKGESGSRRPDF